MSSRSYPFLSISRETGVSYSEVLQYADKIWRAVESGRELESALRSSSLDVGICYRITQEVATQFGVRSGARCWHGVLRGSSCEHCGGPA